MLFIQTADTLHLPVPEGLLHQAVEETLKYSHASQDVDVTVVFTDDQQLHQLNLRFLGVDAPTDVLSFPASFTDPDTDHPYLGDVLISIPRAEAQAVENLHTIQDELMLLVVHGILHLVGYDHVEEAEKALMWAAQSSILSRLSI
jgi:probable rRNA maturation factor